MNLGIYAKINAVLIYPIKYVKKSFGWKTGFHEKQSFHVKIAFWLKIFKEKNLGKSPKTLRSTPRFFILK